MVIKIYQLILIHSGKDRLELQVPSPNQHLYPNNKSPPRDLEGLPAESMGTAAANRE